MPRPGLASGPCQADRTGSGRRRSTWCCRASTRPRPCRGCSDGYPRAIGRSSWTTGRSTARRTSPPGWVPPWWSLPSGGSAPRARAVSRPRRPTWWPSWTRTAHSTRRHLGRGRRPRGRQGRPTWCWAVVVRRRRSAWPWHLRLANRELCRRIHRRTGRAGARPRPDARGPARCPGRTAACPTGGRATRWRCSSPPPTRAGACGEVDVAYLPRSGRSKVTGTPARRGPGRARHEPGAGVVRRRLWRPAHRSAGRPPERTGTLLVIAKEPLPGRVKTRLQSTVHPGPGR